MATGKSFLNEVFAIAYLDWCKTGKIPDFVSEEVRDILTLQKKRMQKLHVTMKCESETGKESDLSKFGYLSSNRSNRQTPHFFSIIRQDLFFRRLIYLVNGSVGYNAYQKDVLVTIATNSRTTEVTNKNADTPKKASNTAASWPQITGFYLYPHAKQNPISGKLEFWLITLPCMALTFLYISYISNLSNNFAFVPFLFTLFGALLFGLIIGFLVWMPYKMFSMMGKAKKALRTNTPSLRSGQKVHTLLKPIIPDFNYEYFVGQLMTMLQTIIFSENRMTLSYYRGENPLAELDSIIDLHSNLNIKVLSHNLTNTTPTLTLQADVVTFRVKENLVKKENETFILDLVFKMTNTSKNDTLNASDPAESELDADFFITKLTVQ